MSNVNTAISYMWSNYQTNYANRLFGSLNSGGNSFSSLPDFSSIINDYSNLRNGTIKDAINSYYGKNSSSTTTGSNKLPTLSNSAATEKKNLAEARNSADALKTSADVLAATGNKSVFNQGTDAIVKAVKNFAEDYNAMLTSASKLDNTSALGTATSMVSLTKMNEKMLNKVGITIGENNKLTVNEEVLKSADVNDLKSIFNGSASYSSMVSLKARTISNTAALAANMSAGIYGKNGYYTTQAVSGLLFDGLF